MAEKFALKKLGIVSRIEWLKLPKYPKYRLCSIFLTHIDLTNAVEMMIELMKTTGFKLFFEPDKFWTVFINNKPNAKALPNVHMDIDVIVPTGTSVDAIYAKIQSKSIGKIAGHYFVPVCAEMKDANKTVICIVFEFWHRNKFAITLQQALLTSEFANLYVAAPCAEITENDECECKHTPLANNVEVWRVQQSIQAPILPGVSPYIWYPPI